MKTTKLTPCERADCGHIRMHHCLTKDGRWASCAIAGCPCRGYLAPVPEPAPSQ